MAEEWPKYASNDAGAIMVQKNQGMEWEKVRQIESDNGPNLLLIDGDWKPIPQRVQEGLIKTEKAQLVERALKIGMDPKSLFVDASTETESQLAGLDKGLEDVAYGANQLFQHLLPSKDTTEIDATIAEREKYAPNNLGQFTGNVAGMLAPGLLGVKAARFTPLVQKLGFAGEATIGGALEGASMPVTGDNFAADKAMQVGGTAALSGGVATGIKAVTKGGEIVANTGRNAENLPGQLSARQVRQGSPMAVEGDRLANQYDVPLTPGQSSDSATLKFLEQRARQSWLSKEAALEGDLIRSQKLRDSIENQAGNIDSATFATRLQANVNSFVRGLARNRSEVGREMYGEIERFSGGQQIIRPDNVRRELQSIIEETGSQTTGDAAKIAKQAQAMLDEIPAGDISRGGIPGGYTAKEALARLQSWSPFSNGTVFDDVSAGFDAVQKRRIYGALLEDMKAAEQLGDNLGEMVQRANAAWRKASENIDSVHKSALGKIVGEDVASDLFNFNTVAPEQVMDKLNRLRPSQAKAVTSFLSENMTDVLPELRGAILKDAVDASMEMAATSGAQVQFNAGNFLRSLGLTGGKRGAESTSRLMAYFGGSSSPEWKTMSDLIQLSRRIADTSGKNFSDTAAANQFFDIIRRGMTSGGNFIGAVGGTVLEGAGLKRITQSMNPSDALFGGFSARPLLRAPRVIQKAPLPAGLAAPAVSDELNN